MVAPRRPVSKDLNTVVMQSSSRSVSMLGGAAIVLLTCANICTLAENIWWPLTRRSPPRPPTTPPPSGEFSAFSRSSCSRMDWDGNISLLFIIGYQWSWCRSDILYHLNQRLVLWLSVGCHYTGWAAPRGWWAASVDGVMCWHWGTQYCTVTT